jgi:hypothetical protein
MNLLPEQNSVVRSALSEIQDMLPPKMLQKLPEFEISNSNYVLIANSGSIDSVCKSDDSIHYGDSKAIFGMTSSEIGKAVLTINDELLNEKISSNCTLKQKRELLIRTLIHEISHVYDFSNKPLQVDCSKSSYDCLRKTAMSDELQFLLLAGFRPIYSEQEEGFPENKDSLSFQRLNIFMDRSPRSYEATNPQEYFAVNMEYFLLDPEFQCHRPALYHLLSRHFDQFPFPNQKCSSGFSVIDVNNHILNLDPKRIYQIHYLKSSPGAKVQSQWGHSMIRFIVCAPERLEKNSECLKDTKYHIVVDFAAQLLDEKLSIVGGLMGEYPNAPNFKLFSDLRSETLLNSDRSLESYPLLFTQDEVVQFVRSITQLYWSQESKYYFMGNNCATQVMNVILTAIERPEIVNNEQMLNILNSKNIMTPSGAIYYFEKIGLINLKGYAKKDESTYFLSTSQKMELNLLPFFKDKSKIKAFVSSTPFERKSIYQKLVLANNSTPDSKLKLIEGVSSLEQIEASKIIQNSIGQINSFRMGLIKSGTFKKMKIADLPNAKNSAWEGYGIPMDIQSRYDLIMAKYNQVFNDEIQHIFSYIPNELKLKLSENKAKSIEIAENIKFLSANL